MTSTELDPEAVRLGATIRALRRANGLKITDLAAAVGVSRPYMNNVELGAKKATPKLCIDVARALGVPVTALTVPETVPA